MAIIHHADVARTVPGAVGVAASVDFKRVSDDSPIGSAAVADADGFYQKSLAASAVTGQTSYELHPGPYYAQFTHTGTTRRHSSLSFGSAGPLAIGLLSYLTKALGNGVVVDPPAALAQFAVTTDQVGRDIDVATGVASIEGVVVANDASRNIAISANISGSTRVDTVVLEVVVPGQATEGKATLKVVEGTAGAGAPSLTQSSALWQFPLANVSVADSATVINTGDLTDRRTYLNTTPTGAIKVLFDGAGTALPTGVYGYVSVPFACTITGWRLLAKESTSVVIDVWKQTFANYPPTDADRIAGTEKPTLASAIKNEDTALSTWTTAVAAGDVLGFEVESATASWAELTLSYTKDA